MAEPRRRKKWTLNPRGTLWANDDSKFGQKLMEKMGWSKGRGLGREEQGMKEHLSVKFKDDNKGIGYKGSDDEWIKHYEDFENVLANLNKQDNTPTNGTGDSSNDSSEAPDHNNVGKTSLESSSKASRSRVHYHKFTRGKDLSRCTEDDLGCILGSKRAKQLAREKKLAETKEVNDDVDEVGHVDHSMGVTTIKGCSMQDYFAQKMEALRNRAKSQPQIEAEENQCGDEEEDMERSGLGMSTGGSELTPDSPDGEEENREERRKKKKRKKHQVETEEINSVETKSEKCCIEVEENNMPKKKKKKKKQECSDFNGTNEIACETSGVEASTENTAQIKSVVNEETQRKKKKRHSGPVEEQALNAETEEQIRVKKKKKRKHTEVTDENNPSQCLVVEENTKKKKKKKLKAKE
uniref:G-patch domain-containing protein n=1 Tax=Scylla olivacea TaxID=85551 RepID=A0A0P4W199_SCYOL